MTVIGGNDILSSSSAHSPVPQLPLNSVVQTVGVVGSVGLDHGQAAVRHTKVGLEDTEQGGDTLASAGARQDDLHARSECVLIETDEYDRVSVSSPAEHHVLHTPRQVVPGLLASSSAYLKNKKIPTSGSTFSRHSATSETFRLDQGIFSVSSSLKTVMRREPIISLFSTICPHYKGISAGENLMCAPECLH